MHTQFHVTSWIYAYTCWTQQFARTPIFSGSVCMALHHYIGRNFGKKFEFIFLRSLQYFSASLTFSSRSSHEVSCALHIHPVGFLRSHTTALNYDIPLCCIWQPYALGYSQLCRRMTPMHGVILRQFFCVFPAFIIYCLFTQVSYLYPLHARWCGSLSLASAWHSVSKELFILYWRQKVKRVCRFPREAPYLTSCPTCRSWDHCWDGARLTPCGERKEARTWYHWYKPSSCPLACQANTNGEVWVWVCPHLPPKLKYQGKMWVGKGLRCPNWRRALTFPASLP